MQPPRKTLVDKMKAADTPEGRARRRGLATGVTAGVGKAVKAGITAAATPAGKARRQAFATKAKPVVKQMATKLKTPTAQTNLRNAAVGAGQLAKAGIAKAASPAGVARRKKMATTIKKHRGKIF